MPATITSDARIGASVDEVWRLTIDVERWPRLTPTMTSVERLDDGPMRVGSSARVVQPRQRPTVWTVTKLDAPHVFEWQAKILTVTMTGAHHLAADGDHCRNELRLVLSGFGSRLMGRLLGSTMRKAIETENLGFKHEAELAHRS
jgi:uncharacterized membrane protein